MPPTALHKIEYDLKRSLTDPPVETLIVEGAYVEGKIRS